MRYLSLFSGIEAASVAGKPLGWVAAAVAETDKFCRSVLQTRWPLVPNLGDVRQLRRSHVCGPVDLVVGGSPCVSFSIAGKREALDDPRGQLIFEIVRVCSEFTPRWVLFENVANLVSINASGPFKALLGALHDIGYSVGWRVLDARFFGVPQRRRRVYILGYRGRWTRPAEALFEPEVHDSGTGESATQKSAHPARDFTKILGPDGYAPKQFGTLMAKGYGYGCTQSPVEYIIDRQGARQLTPLECERLQGFPDGYTAIPYRRGIAPDTQRVRVLGNSMAVPVMTWLGRRIEAADISEDFL
jgi:DNA (cytosine-5)-methyltransferase 1